MAEQRDLIPAGREQQPLAVRVRIDIASQPLHRVHKRVLRMARILPRLHSIDARRQCGHRQHRPPGTPRPHRFSRLRLLQQHPCSSRHHDEAEKSHHRKIARLRMVLVGHEKDVARHGPHRRAKDRVQQQLAAPVLAPHQSRHRRARQHQPSQRNQDVVHPQSPMKGPPQAYNRPVELRRLDVFVHHEEVLVVAKQTRAGDHRHPRSKAHRKRACRGQRTAQRKPPLLPQRQHHRPAQRRKQKNRRRLGKHHQRKQQADPHRSPHWPPHLRQSHRQVQRAQRKRDQHRLQNCQPAEAIKERAGRHQRHGQQSRPARSAHSQQQIAQQQIGKEERDRKPPRRLHRDPGKKEQHPLQKRPHRHRRRRVEIPRQIPVAEQVRANRRIPIPTLIGIFGPVPEPRSVVGKVGSQVQRMQRRESADQNQPHRIEPAFPRHHRRRFPVESKFHKLRAGRMPRVYLCPSRSNVDSSARGHPAANFCQRSILGSLLAV